MSTQAIDEITRNEALSSSPTLGTNRAGHPDEDSSSTPSDPATRLLLCASRIKAALDRAERLRLEVVRHRAVRAALWLIDEAVRTRGNLGLSLKTAANSLHVSQNHLGREFQRITGLRFRVFLRYLRITRTADLLANTDMPFGEIAAQLGHVQSGNLAREFRFELGAPPTEFRRLVRAGILVPEPFVAAGSSEKFRA